MGSGPVKAMASVTPLLRVPIGRWSLEINSVEEMIKAVRSMSPLEITVTFKILVARGSASEALGWVAVNLRGVPILVTHAIKETS